MNITKIPAVGAIFMPVTRLTPEQRTGLAYRGCDVRKNPSRRGEVIIRGQQAQETFMWKGYDAAKAQPQ